MARRWAVAALLSILGGCSTSDRSLNPPEVRLAVGGRAQFIYLPATLAVELGFAHDEGLTVTLQDFEGGSKSLESLLGGSSDVVCGFYDHTIQMAAQGRQLTAFLVMLQYPGLVAVAVAPEVARIEDLKGRTVGVSSAGSSTHMFLNYLLTTHGLAPGDVATANIGMAGTAVAAVTRGQVALAIMTDPALGAILRQVPAARILADTRTAAGVAEAFGTATYPSAVLYTKSDWLAQNPDRAAALARAFRRAVAWIRERSAEEVWQRLPPEFRTEREADLAGLRALQGMLSPDGRMQQEAAQAVRRVLAVSLESVRTADIDLSKTYTNGFVEQ